MKQLVTDLAVRYQWFRKTFKSFVIAAQDTQDLISAFWLLQCVDSSKLANELRIEAHETQLKIAFELIKRGVRFWETASFTDSQENSDDS